MKLNPNCSEAVYRLKLKDYKEHKKEIDKVVKNNHLSFESTGKEYSPQRPKKGEICIYAYQLCGDSDLFNLLIKNILNLNIMII